MIQLPNQQKGWISDTYFAPFPFINDSVDLKPFCQTLNQKFDHYQWHQIRCLPKDWHVGAYTSKGNPLLYTVIGDSGPTSFLLCSVHSDEATVFHCFKLLKLLQQSPDILTQRLVILPLMNPDGFLIDQPSRVNGRGVDLNRNLPTKDWDELALKVWIKNYQRHERRYPGASANSEVENQFLIHLIQQYRPDKIISIHSPLNFLDLDYLETTLHDQTTQKTIDKAKALATQLSKDSRLILQNYQTFPGSLGRYGNEWNFPVYTLELPTASPAQADGYFERMKSSLILSFNIILNSRQNATTEKTETEEDLL